MSSPFDQENSSDLEDVKRTSESNSRKPVDGSSGITPVRMTMSYEGPLPPPAVLEAYGRIVPNGAERIFVSFERQVSHRQAMESAVVGSNIKMQFLGFAAALLLATGTITAGFWFVYLGKGLVGIAAIITALASLLTVFVVGKRAQQAERDQKMPPGR